MTKFDCGCRIMTDVITLNGRNQPMWNYLLKIFVNVCGKCYRKHMKFQYMENKLMEMTWRWKNKEWTCFWKMRMKNKTHTLI